MDYRMCRVTDLLSNLRLTGLFSSSQSQQQKLDGFLLQNDFSVPVCSSNMIPVPQSTTHWFVRYNEWSNASDIVPDFTECLRHIPRNSCLTANSLM